MNNFSTLSISTGLAFQVKQRFDGTTNAVNVYVLDIQFVNNANYKK